VYSAQIHWQWRLAQVAQMGCQQLGQKACESHDHGGCLLACQQHYRVWVMNWALLCPD